MAEEIATSIGVSVPEMIPEMIPAVPAAPETQEKTKVVPPAGTDAYRAYNKAVQQRSRAHKAESKQASSLKFDSKMVPTKAEAMEQLSQRVFNSHVREVCYEDGQEAAEATGVTPNKFFWAHGLTQTLASGHAEEAKPLQPPHNGVDKITIDSECIHLSDAYAIWDYSVSWREPEITFDMFIQTRKKLKSDWLELGYFMEKGGPYGLCEQPHRSWQKFLPQFTPGLKPLYTQAEENIWIASCVPAKQDFLLMCSRNSLKTSCGLLFLAQVLLCAPCVRILTCSETTKLSKSFVKSFRALWEVGAEKNRFQYWFPEYMIQAGAGSILEFECPMRHLSLPQASISAASFETTVAGGRFNVAWVDDPVSNTNTATIDTRVKGTETFAALMKLREAAGGSVVVTVGTPWVGGDENEPGDLYFELMKRNDADPDKSLAVMVQPAWTRKPGVSPFIDILSLTEENVDLAYPTRLNFKFLMKEARASAPTFFLFRTQNLVEYPPSSESLYAVNFDEATLRNCIVSYNYGADFKVLRTIQSWDCAHTAEKYSDLSACISIRVLADSNQHKNVALVYNCFMDRLRPSILAKTIIEKAMQDHPDIVVIEKFPQYETLGNEINRLSNMYGYLPNIYWQPVNTRFSATGLTQKAARAKFVEPLFEGPKGRLLLTEAEWVDILIAQLVNFNGLHRSGYKLEKKDDSVDALSQAIIYIQQLIYQPGDPRLEHQTEIDEENLIQMQIAAQYKRIHGMPMGNQQLIPPPEIEEPDTNPLSSLLSKHGMWKR